MGNIVSTVVTGGAGTTTMIAGQGGFDVDIVPVIATKASYLSVDLLSQASAYSHAFTIGNLMTCIGFSMTILAVYIALRSAKHNRRDGDK